MAAASASDRLTPVTAKKKSVLSECGDPEPLFPPSDGSPQDVALASPVLVAPVSPSVVGAQEVAASSLSPTNECEFLQALPLPPRPEDEALVQGIAAGRASQLSGFVAAFAIGNARASLLSSGLSAENKRIAVAAVSGALMTTEQNDVLRTAEAYNLTSSSFQRVGASQSSLHTVKLGLFRQTPSSDWRTGMLGQLVPFSKDCHTSDPHTHVPFAGLQSCAPSIADSQLSAARPRSKFQIWQQSRELAGQYMPLLSAHAKCAPMFYQEAMERMGGLEGVDWTDDDKLKELRTTMRDLKAAAHNDRKKRRILEQVLSSSSNALVIPAAPQVVIAQALDREHRIQLDRWVVQCA
jgi:hypothetical protein